MTWGAGIGLGQFAQIAMLAPMLRKFANPKQSWSRKSAQDDKWSFCLTVGTLCPANQERP